MPTDTAAMPAAQERAWITPVELLVLGAIWGASFLFTRVAARDFGPFLLVEIRLALGALALLPFLWRERAKFPLAIWRAEVAGYLRSLGGLMDAESLSGGNDWQADAKIDLMLPLRVRPACAYARTRRAPAAPPVCC